MQELIISEFNLTEEEYYLSEMQKIPSRQFANWVNNIPESALTESLKVMLVVRSSGFFKDFNEVFKTEKLCLIAISERLANFMQIPAHLHNQNFYTKCLISAPNTLRWMNLDLIQPQALIYAIQQKPDIISGLKFNFVSDQAVNQSKAVMAIEVGLSALSNPTERQLSAIEKNIVTKAIAWIRDLEGPFDDKTVDALRGLLEQLDRLEVENVDVLQQVFTDHIMQYQRQKEKECQGVYKLSI